MQHPINMLPASYWRERRRQRRTVRQSALLVILAGALAAWWFLQGQQTEPLRAEAVILERQVQQAKHHKNEVKKLHDRYASLRRQVRVRDLLAQPVSQSQILATLAEQMPESVTLMRMSTTAERPAPSLESSNNNENGNSNSASHAAHEVRIEMTAMAPDDMTIANLLSSLNRHALFNDATMHYSRTVERDDVIARQFRLGVRVDLDRRFQPIADARGEGVANVE